MTPKELLKELEDCKTAYQISSIMTFDEYESYAIKLIKQAKSEWCKEQRKICANTINKDSYECTIKENKNRIINSLEPK